MKKQNLEKAKKTVKESYAMSLRQTVRARLIGLIDLHIVNIEKEFCRQDCCDFRLPDEDRNIVLDADCVNAADFIYQTEVEDPVTGMTAIEKRTLGKISMDCDGRVCLYPRGDRDFDDEMKATDLDTDTLFRLCGYLDVSLQIISL